MYDFVTHTWNTVKGKCPHGCSYCYMKNWGEQKPIRFCDGELKTDLGGDNYIFVGSSCDMWAEQIPILWIEWTLKHCNKFSNEYLFQTKNPMRYKDFIDLIPHHSLIGTTIETNRHYHEFMSSIPTNLRAEDLRRIPYFKRFVTIEPIMDFDLDEMVYLIKRTVPIQVNIGADSGNNNLPEPSADKIKKLIEELSKFTIIAKKRNLGRLGV
jgi:DNA repair photolyase